MHFLIGLSLSLIPNTQLTYIYSIHKIYLMSKEAKRKEGVKTENLDVVGLRVCIPQQ